MKPIYIFLLLPLSLVTAQTDDLDELFDDPDSGLIEEAVVMDKPEESIFSGDKFIWAGDITSTMGMKYGFTELAPNTDKLLDGTERLTVKIGAKLWFDARPDKNFRVFGKFTTDYPFSTKIKSLADPSKPFGPDNQVSTAILNNIKIFELFSDFNYEEKIFFRFGKQTAAWGLSRFYQIADPITVGVKDPQDPTADLEGPLALKVALPLGVNNLYFYSVMKESYIPSNPLESSLRDLGIGLKADFLIPIPKNGILGNGEFTVGGYYQRNQAPKAIAGLSTSVGNFQIFTDQAMSWGLDSYRLSNETVLLDLDGGGPSPSKQINLTEKTTEGIFYSATAGTMYVNNDWHFTLYGEYMYNSAGSPDEKYLSKWAETQAAETLGFLTNKTLIFSDLFGYLSQHNSGLSLSLSELFGSDKLGASTLWLQNWVDRSGMSTTTLSFKPFDHVVLEGGATLAWGEDVTEWVIKNYDPVTKGPKRLTGFINFKLGAGRF